MGQPKIDSANVPIGVNWLRIWRDLETKKRASPYYTDLPNTAAWITILTSSTFPIAETSNIRVSVVWLAGVDMGANGECYWYFRLRQNGTAPADHPVQTDRTWYSAGATQRETPFADSYTWRGLAPGDYTYTFEVAEGSQTARLRRCYYPVMQIDICKA